MAKHGVEGSDKSTGTSTTSQGDSEMRIIERIVIEGDSAAHFPLLTRTNYAEWAILMKVQLQAKGLWDVVKDGTGEGRDDRRAMSALLRAVPPELIRTLGAKATAKEAWDTLKIMRVGVERVREAKAQTRRLEYEHLAFKDGEGVESFGLRLTTLINDLELLGDPVTEHTAVLKFLRSVPRAYKQMAMAIESLVDLKTLSIEELTGRLLVVEERGDLEDPQPAGGRLLFTEEEWLARQKQQEHERGSGSSGSGDKRGKGYSKQKAPGGERSSAGNSSGGGSGQRRKGECRYCGIPGHWAKECRKAKRDRERKANQVHIAQLEEEQPALLLAAGGSDTDTTSSER